MKTISRHLTIYILAILLIGCTPSDADFQSNVPASHPSENPTEPTSIVENTLPEEFNLDIQFYSQAPKSDWDMPYQEACEEASLILAYNYLTLRKMTVEEFDQALRDMVTWQIDTYGVHKDITIEELGIIAEKYLGFANFEIIENPTVEQIKKFLVKGYPIIAPFAGRELGNPFFTGEGPIYHMLVIRGYEHGPNGLQFITNDVGTRRGKNFVYDENVLMNALHDWVEGANKDASLMNQGAKRILVLKGM